MKPLSFIEIEEKEKEELENQKVWRDVVWKQGFTFQKFKKHYCVEFPECHGLDDDFFIYEFEAFGIALTTTKLSNFQQWIENQKTVDKKMNQ